MKEKVIALRDSGKTFTDIGKEFGFSRQRAQQIYSGRPGGKHKNPRIRKKPSLVEPIERRSMILVGLRNQIIK